MKFRLLGQTQQELKQKNNVHQTYSKNVTFKKELHKIKKKKNKIKYVESWRYLAENK